jgi:hypothetical protein
MSLQNNAFNLIEWHREWQFKDEEEVKTFNDQETSLEEEEEEKLNELRDCII